jgi:NADH dehydrogenase
MNVPHIVIVGGGFGGLYTARNLESLVKRNLARVTIINRENYFLFTPLLHEVATGALSPNSVIEPIREVLRDSDAHFIQAEVKSIDAEAKKIKTGSGIIDYDYLVIGSGASTNYYGVPGAEKYSLTLKTLSDAADIRTALIKACEKAALTTDMEERRRLLSVAIVGGGATGVEIASELIEFMHTTLCAYYHHACFDTGDMSVTLVASSPELLPQFPAEIRTIALNELTEKGITVKLGQNVIGVTNHQLQIGKPATKENQSGTEVEIPAQVTSIIDAQTIIWVAGVAASQWEIPGTEKERGNRIKVDANLRVIGHPEIFALGDVAGTAPMLAQIAVQQAKSVANTLSATITNRQNKIKPFTFTEKGILISLGQWSAAGKIYGKILKGPFMWFLWRSIYLMNFHSWRKRFRIATEWTVDLFYPRDISSF